MAANRPYGEFYDFYSASLEYFGNTLAFHDKLWNQYVHMKLQALEIPV
jgi:hypothetical protein